MIDQLKTDEELAGPCPFCPMFEGNDALHIDIEPLNPVTKGHRLVIPREHVSDFIDDPVVTARAMEYAAELAEKLKKQQGYAGMNLITSQGRCATQSVFHLHIHLVPRREGDGLHLPWTGQKK